MSGVRMWVEPKRSNNITNSFNDKKRMKITKESKMLCEFSVIVLVNYQWWCHDF
jgi:flagellar biosynthesis/type III secretory pathway M-ring protein FliF/YscJ